MQANNEAATDVQEFVSDLDGGVFESKLGVILSMVAAAVIDNQRPGQVVITLDLKNIAKTSQIHIEHKMKFVRPTESGKASEEETRVTTMHVGKFGKLSLSQPDMFKKKQTEIV